MQRDPPGVDRDPASAVADPRIDTPPTGDLFIDPSVPADVARDLRLRGEVVDALHALVDLHGVPPALQRVVALELDHLGTIGGAKTACLCTSPPLSVACQGCSKCRRRHSLAPCKPGDARCRLVHGHVMESGYWLVRSRDPSIRRRGPEAKSPIAAFTCCWGTVHSCEVTPPRPTSPSMLYEAPP